MKANIRSASKIGILILIIVMGSVSCGKQGKQGHSSVVRFEKLVFGIPPTVFADSIRQNHKNLLTFFRIFNEEIIGIGPDSLPGYPEQLTRFISDTMIRQVYAAMDKLSGTTLESCRLIDKAMDRWVAMGNGKRPDHLVTYISGFNQSFITLPGCLCIGTDNYLGSESPFYQGLSIPVYIRKNMNPENLPADAVRAWLYSELPGLSAEGNFLDRMIYEGKVYYIAEKLLPGTSQENLFHYTKDQLLWCKNQELAMWKFLAEENVLFSTDRLRIRKYMDEAPFTRDFGNESPGKTGIWIGYRIVCSFMKSTGTSLKELINITEAKEILSASKYHP